MRPADSATTSENPACYWKGMWQKLNAMRQLWQLCDITLFSEDNSMFMAHSAVLAASSEALHGFFVEGKADFITRAKDDNNKVIIHGVTSEVLQVTLDFIYGVTPNEKHLLQQLMEGATALGIKGAAMYCQIKLDALEDSPATEQEASVQTDRQVCPISGMRVQRQSEDLTLGEQVNLCSKPQQETVGTNPQCKKRRSLDTENSSFKKKLSRPDTLNLSHCQVNTPGSYHALGSSPPQLTDGDNMDIYLPPFQSPLHHKRSVLDTNTVPDLQTPDGSFIGDEDSYSDDEDNYMSSDEGDYALSNGHDNQVTDTAVANKSHMCALNQGEEPEIPESHPLVDPDYVNGLSINEITTTIRCPHLQKMAEKGTLRKESVAIPLKLLKIRHMLKNTDNDELGSLKQIHAPVTDNSHQHSIFDSSVNGDNDSVQLCAKTKEQIGTQSTSISSIEQDKKITFSASDSELGMVNSFTQSSAPTNTFTNSCSLSTSVAVTSSFYTNSLMASSPEDAALLMGSREEHSSPIEGKCPYFSDGGTMSPSHLLKLKGKRNRCPIMYSLTEDDDEHEAGDAAESNMGQEHPESSLNKKVLMPDHPHAVTATTRGDKKADIGHVPSVETNGWHTVAPKAMKEEHNANFNGRPFISPKPLFVMACNPEQQVSEYQAHNQTQSPLIQVTPTTTLQYSSVPMTNPVTTFTNCSSKQQSPGIVGSCTSMDPADNQPTLFVNTVGGEFQSNNTSWNQAQDFKFAVPAVPTTGYYSDCSSDCSLSSMPQSNGSIVDHSHKSVAGISLGFSNKFKNGQQGANQNNGGSSYSNIRNTSGGNMCGRAEGCDVGPPVVKHTCPLPQCGRTFRSHASLQKHASREHNVPDTFECRPCKRTFFSQDERDSHRCVTHYCESCGQSFATSAQLQSHTLREHQRGRLFTCEQCEFKSPRRKDVQAHMVAQHNFAPEGVHVYSCKHCNYKCIDKNRAEEHEAVHTGQLKHQCGLCGKSYTTRRGMRTHLQYHSDERPHKCEVCGATFKVRSKLRDHIRLLHTHAGVKPFKCGYCSHSTALRGNCNQHIRKHHPGHDIIVIDTLAAQRRAVKSYDYAGISGKDIKECPDVANTRGNSHTGEGPGNGVQENEHVL